MPSLTKKMEEVGRYPIIEYSHFVTEVYEGALVDEILQQTRPGFNKKHHKGYLVPIEFRKVIENSINSKNESM